MQWLKKKALEMTLLAHLWIEKKNYAGLLFSVAKDVIYKSSHHAVLSLCTAKLFQFRNVFPFDVLHFCMDIGGYFCFCFKSR